VLHVKYLPRESDSVHLQRGTEINERGSRVQSTQTAINACPPKNAALLIYFYETQTQHKQTGLLCPAPCAASSAYQHPIQGRTLQPLRPSSWSKWWCEVLKHESSRPQAECLASRSETAPDPRSPSQSEAASAHCGLADTHRPRAAQSPELLEHTEVPCGGVNLLALSL